MNCWITTHWPAPTGWASSRHVYVGKNNPREDLPIQGDLVLIYEMKNPPARRATRVHRRAQRQFSFPHGSISLPAKRDFNFPPKGRDSIILAVTVTAAKREVDDSDEYIELGNDEQKQWYVIPCSDPIPVYELRRADAMELMGYGRKQTPTFWNLWRVPDQHVVPLLTRLLTQ